MKALSAIFGALLVIAVGLVLPVKDANAMPAGWTGACEGRDYVQRGPNGSYIIWHNAAICA